MVGSDNDPGLAQEEDLFVRRDSYQITYGALREDNRHGFFCLIITTELFLFY